MNSIELVRYITYMCKKGDYVAGHSVFKGRNIKMNQILMEGLIIQDASVGLGFTARRFESEFEENLLNLQDLSDVAEESVIIISIPNELIGNYKPKYFKSYDSSSIVLENMNQCSDLYRDVYGNPTRMVKLPTKYILGYLDTSTDIFINNSNYAFNRYQRDINILNEKQFLDRKYKDILRKNGFQDEKPKVKDCEEDLER